jgi:hypothetical protein
MISQQLLVMRGGEELTATHSLTMTCTRLRYGAAAYRWLIRILPSVAIACHAPAVERAKPDPGEVSGCYALRYSSRLAPSSALGAHVDSTIVRLTLVPDSSAPIQPAFVLQVAADTLGDESHWYIRPNGVVELVWFRTDAGFRAQLHREGSALVGEGRGEGHVEDSASVFKINGVRVPCDGT